MIDGTATARGPVIQLEQQGQCTGLDGTHQRVQTQDGFGSSSMGPHVRFRRGQTLVRSRSLSSCAILLSNPQVLIINRRKPGATTCPIRIPSQPATPTGGWPC